MRRDKIITGLIAWALAMLTALAGIGCIVTGFALPVTDWNWILLFCALFAALAALCCSFRWSALALPAVGLLFMLPNWNSVIASVLWLLNHISALFDTAYGWGVIPVLDPGSSVVPTVEPALIAMAFPVTAGICWTVCRRRWVGFGLLAGLAPLMLCCVVTDTVPSVWCITMLLAALMTLTLTQYARKRDMRSGNRFTAIAMIPVLLISLLLPHHVSQANYTQQSQRLQEQLLNLLEQIPGGFWQGPGLDGPSTPPSINGQTGPVDLEQVGPMTIPSTPKMYVNIVYDSLELLYNGSFYLRGSSYDTYTGTSWLAEADTVNENGWPYAGMNPGGTVFIGLSRGASSNTLFFPYYTQGNNWTDNLVQGTLLVEEPLSYYSFDYYIGSGSASYTPLTAQETEIYLSLPLTTQAAADEILLWLLADEQVLTVRQKAEMIAEYVQNSAAYDLETQKMPADADDFAIWFLENSDTGYCVHFASAATVLLRAAGIPARYVTGYLTHITNNTALVTEDQAHAWVEYLDPNQGWTVLEVTPGSAERIEPTEPPVETTAPTDIPTEEPTDEPTEEPTVETTAPTDEPTEEPTDDPTAPSQATQPSGTVAPPPGDDTPEVNLTWLWYMLGILLLWALLAAQHWLRRRIRCKRLMKGDNNRQALRRWRYVRRAVRILKLPMPEHLQALAEKAVFSQHILTDGELEEFDLWLKKAKRQLLTKPWPIRLTLWFVYAI